MAMYLDNPAGRLHSLLSAFRTSANNQPIWRAWASVFNVTGEDIPETVRCISLLLALPGEIESEIARVAPDEYEADIVLRWRAKIVPALGPALFSNQTAAGIVSSFDDGSLTSLEACSWTLHKYRRQRVIGSSDLGRIHTLLTELETELANSADLDAELREFLMRHCKEMLRALRDIAICGAAALEDAFDKATGASAYRRMDLTARATVTETGIMLLTRIAVMFRHLRNRIRGQRSPSADKQTPTALNELFVTLVQEAMERGAEQQEIAAAVVESAQAAALVVADALEADAPRMLREHKAIRDGFERRLQQRWGRALNLYECVYVCCLESGENFQKKHGAVTGRDVDAKFGALMLLHGRACLVASEVYGLLRTGHAAGAQARWRTLHELAVVAFTLANSDSDISERFLLHRGVEQYKDAKRYQEHCEDLGYEKFSDEDMEEMRRVSDDLVARFGPEFKEDWGWAKPLFPGRQRMNFISLEKHVGFDHFRPWYGLANHGIHSGATGAIHVIDFYGRGREMLAGPSNAGLADPANGALISLQQVTVALLIHGVPTPPDAEEIITCQAIQVMLDRAQQSFLEIHSALEEEDIQTEN